MSSAMAILSHSATPFDCTRMVSCSSGPRGWLRIQSNMALRSNSIWLPCKINKPGVIGEDIGMVGLQRGQGYSF